MGIFKFKAKMKDYNYGDIALDDIQFTKNSCDQEFISYDEGNKIYK